jgi:hypothetical protein
LSKGQPDFFGQPQQPRFGEFKALAQEDKTFVADLGLTVTYTGKGVLREIILHYRSSASYLDGNVVISVDGDEMVNSILGYLALPRSTSIYSIVPTIDFWDVSLYEIQLRWNKDIDFQDSVSVVFTGAGGLGAGNQASIAIMGSEIV